MKSDTPNIWKIAGQTKYPVDAFFFIQRGLDYTVRHIHGEMAEDFDPQDADASRHISGPQLCEGLKQFALSEYGLMARAVLRRYRIYACEDFGHIVFAMVKAELMRKTDEDSIKDFIDVFDFSDAFDQKLVLSENG